MDIVKKLLRTKKGLEKYIVKSNYLNINIHNIIL